MRKFILLAFMSVVSITVVRSQENNITGGIDRLQIGIKAGTNYSNVYDVNGNQFAADSKFGFVAGAFLSIPIVKYLGLQPEVLFSQKGFKATGSILGSNYEFTRTTNYIDIPLLIALKPIGWMTILAGPQYSYLMKQTNVFTNAILSNTQEQEFNNNNIRKNTLCFLGGLDFISNRFILGTRVGWDIQDNNGDGTSSNPKYKNVWYQATLGLRF
jgi:hypothetical protein